MRPRASVVLRGRGGSGAVGAPTRHRDAAPCRPTSHRPTSWPGKGEPGSPLSTSGVGVPAAGQHRAEAAHGEAGLGGPAASRRARRRERGCGRLLATGGPRGRGGGVRGTGRGCATGCGRGARGTAWGRIPDARGGAVLGAGPPWPAVLRDAVVALPGAATHGAPHVPLRPRGSAQPRPHPAPRRPPPGHARVPASFSPQPISAQSPREAPPSRPQAPPPSGAQGGAAGRGGARGAWGGGAKMAAGARGPQRRRPVRTGRTAGGRGERGAGGSGTGRGLGVGGGGRRRGRAVPLAGARGAAGPRGRSGAEPGGPEGGFGPESGSAPLSSPRRNGADGRRRDLHPQVRGGPGRFPPVVGTAAPRPCGASVPAPASSPCCHLRGPGHPVRFPSPPPSVPRGREIVMAVTAHGTRCRPVPRGPAAVPYPHRFLRVSGPRWVPAVPSA